MLNPDLIVANTVTDRHGVVREGGEGSDESSQDVEHAFLLDPPISSFDGGNSVRGAVKGTCHLRLEHGRPWRRRLSRR